MANIGPVNAATAVLLLIAAAWQCASATIDHRQLAQRHHGHGSGAEHHAVPVFAYCKDKIEKVSYADQHQLRESYQEYHAAFARHMRASRNLEAFKKGPATWMEDPAMRQGWNLTYLFGNNEAELTRLADDAISSFKNMEMRIKAQLSALEGQGAIPAGTHIDQLSPCIMTKVYPAHFPDQPVVSLLLRLRGEAPVAKDWPPVEPNATEPPKGKGPEAVEAFIKRLAVCRRVAPLELVVMLSGAAAQQQASAWAWQSWTTEGFVVPILDAQDREAHSLNRLASVARGALLVALRADRPGVADLVPPAADCSWLQRVITLYHRIPQLGAMVHGRYAFAHGAAHSDSMAMLGHVGGAGGPHRNNMYFKEGMTSIPFQYVLYGDYMPLSFRAVAFDEVGGFDEDLPQGGESCGDILRRDLFVRLWKSGWRVGAHDAGLLQKPEAELKTADASDPARCPEQVAALAAQLFAARHGPPAITGPDGAALEAPLAILAGRVKELNIKKLLPMEPDVLSTCPMPQGCKL